MGGGGGGGNDARFWAEKERIDQITPTDFARQSFSTGIPLGLNYRDGLENDTLGDFGIPEPGPAHNGPVQIPAGLGMLTPDMLMQLEMAGLAHEQAGGQIM
jgi:hypothetical protein